MATNEVFQNGDNLSLPVGEGIKSGDPVKVGGLVGVATVSRGEGGNPPDNATVTLIGVHTLEVTGQITAVGQAVYIDSDGALTATATANTLFGHALDTKTAAAADIRVRLVG